MTQTPPDEKRQKSVTDKDDEKLIHNEENRECRMRFARGKTNRINWIPVSNM